MSDSASQKEEEKQKRRRTGSTDDIAKKKLPYKDKCILCNKDVSLYKHNAEKRDYTTPDNISNTNLMNRLRKVADDRLGYDPEDKWALDVKGRLSGIYDLVAEETHLHKLCSTKFQEWRSLNTADGGGRKIDDDRAGLVKTLCDWLDDEMEHQLFTLDEVYQKYLSFDTSSEG